MASIPNQKTITKTIQSQIESLDAVINVVVKAATSKTITMANKNIANLKTYQATMATLFDKNGIVTMITQHTMTLSKMQSMKMPKYRHIRLMTKRLLSYVNDVANTKLDIDKISKVKDKLEPVVNVIKQINQVFNTIAEMKIPGLFTTKFLMIKLGLWRISKLSGFLTLLNVMAPILLSSKISLFLLKQITASLAGIFKDISSIKIGLFLPLKLRFIGYMLRKMMRIVRIIGIIGRYIARVGGFKKTLVLTAVFEMLENVFESIKSIRVGIFMRIKIKRIIRTLDLIRRLVRRIGRIRVPMRAFISLMMLQTVITNLAITLTLIILVTPIVILAIPALFIMLIGVKMVAFFIRRIIKVFIRLARRAVLRGLIAIMLICSLLTTIALMMLIVSLVAEVVMESIWNTIKFLLVIILIAVVLAGLGLLLSLMSPLFIPIAVGLGILLLVIGIIFLMAVMLRIIQELNLDPEKIKENIKLVLQTCRMIIEEIFRSDETENEESDKGWLRSLMNFIGEGLIMVIQAVLAVSYLATMMAGVLCILLMATMLRLIQELELKPDKIMNNVTIVITTCRLIMDLLFKTKPDDPNEGNNEGWLESLLNYMGSGLIMVIKAIFAVAFLTMAMIAISMISFMALQLRGLQILDLKDDLIIENVKTVIDTCLKVIDELFNREEREGTESKNGILITLINFISPELGMVVKAIMAVAFLALSTFAILLLNLLALQLRGLQEIELKDDLIVRNVDIVCDTANKVIDALYNRKDRPDNPSNKGWIRKIIEFVGLGGLVKVIDAILALAWLGMTVGIIALIHTLAKQLSELGTIVIDPNITTKVENICSIADKVVNAIQNRKKPIVNESDSKVTKTLKFLFPRMSEIAESMSRMRWLSDVATSVGLLGELAKNLLVINDIPSLTGIEEKVNQICTSADNIARMINEKSEIDLKETNNSKIKMLERLNNVMKELTDINPQRVTSAQKTLENHMKFIEKINSMDVTKLETSAKLFEHIAEFSKSINGDFENLASSINEELLPLLERLEEIFRETNNLLAETAANTANVENAVRTSVGGGGVIGLSDEEISKMADDQVNLAKWKDGALSEMSEDERKEFIKKYYKNERERAQQDATNNVGEKIDMIYDLLCGLGTGISTHAIVKTV